MRPPDVRPSRPDERTPPAAVSAALAAGCVLLLLAALSPFLTAAGVFAGAVCLVTLRECRGDD